MPALAAPTGLPYGAVKGWLSRAGRDKRRGWHGRTRLRPANGLPTGALARADTGRHETWAETKKLCKCST